MNIVNGVLARGVDLVLVKDFASYALQEMKIHPLITRIRILSMILQMFSPNLHSTNTRHTRVNFVEGTLIWVSKDNDKGSRSKITKHEGTSLQRIQRPRPQDLNDNSNLIDLTRECHNELTSGEIVSLKILSRTMEVRS
ncbi:hypothetical protein Tco_0863639 [Tanacetum coccineum]